MAGLTDEEKTAMKERLQDTEGEKAVLAKIKAMKGSDYTIGMRLHKIIRKNAPALVPKTWYGMPAYATRDGKVVCFFQSAARFKTRYLTLGFSDKAGLDEGDMWPISFAVIKLTPAIEIKISALVKKAYKG